MVRQHILKKNGVVKLFTALIVIGLVISVEFVTTQPDAESVPVRNIQSLTVWRDDDDHTWREPRRCTQGDTRRRYVTTQREMVEPTSHP